MVEMSERLAIDVLWHPSLSNNGTPAAHKQLVANMLSGEQPHTNDLSERAAV
jgi:hypothetical protein